MLYLRSICTHKSGFETKNMKKDLFNNYHAITEIRKKLNKNKSLIGFSGGAWTLACYMIDGSSKTNFIKARELMNKDKIYNGAIMFLIIYL